MNIPQDIKDTHEIVKVAGKQLFVVGGCVRDHLIGSNIKDWDMATDAMPDEITDLLTHKYRLDFTGKSFGVIRVYTKDCPKGYEIATFRQDVSVGRQPEVKLGVSIEEDVKRRDFTINALFFDLDKNEIVDLVGGLNDLENGIIRCVGVAEDRFNEDRLRVLRAIRFSLRFGFKIEDETKAAIHACKVLEGPDKDGNIIPIVRERINEELVKSFDQLSSPLMYFTVLHEFGILEQVLPRYSYPDKLINSRSPAVIIASMYFGGIGLFISFRDWLVQDLKFSNELADGVDLLLDAASVLYTDKNISELAYQIAKKRSRITSITDEDMIVFLHWVMDNRSSIFAARAVALSVYKLSITGAEILKDGIEPGPAVGIEQRSREQIKFDYLLQSCGRSIREEK